MLQSGLALVGLSSILARVAAHQGCGGQEIARRNLGMIDGATGYHNIQRRYVDNGTTGEHSLFISNLPALTYRLRCKRGVLVLHVSACGRRQVAVPHHLGYRGSCTRRYRGSDTFQSSRRAGKFHGSECSGQGHAQWRLLQVRLSLVLSVTDFGCQQLASPRPTTRATPIVGGLTASVSLIRLHTVGKSLTTRNR